MKVGVVDNEDNNFKVREKASGNQSFVKKDNYTRCMNSAIYSLAMREHSRLELHNKLKNKDFSEGVDLNVLLDELEDNNYLNDERFTESFIRSRAGRGQGAMKISQELMIRGINSASVAMAIKESRIDWYKLASEQREKKFGEIKPIEFKEKARQMRFLFGRGFDARIARAVVE